jgi:hypothetical protein
MNLSKVNKHSRSGSTGQPCPRIDFEGVANVGMLYVEQLLRAVRKEWTWYMHVVARRTETGTTSVSVDL